MKKLLKNKRGIAMESAVLFMLVMFMFGFLLTGIAMTAHLRVKVNNSILSREMEIEQIGENFVYMSESDFSTHINSFNNKYTATVGTNGDNKTLTLKRKETIVLYVEVDTTQNIKVWKYSIEDN